ncbi:hypothetical protein RB10929 [Rhodopirellula baltica SH 1]|uniref:Uncharacterized protein n=1 Tax=Rhodopirellula baltica (strain DSM 10527 / NCIMB 13988 / SH1) TaxID=243090 RepID=Q7UK11_RHOBA|nr:hypothetical protein RB10929 [Rhodopirellula baltica SH 1]
MSKTVSLLSHPDTTKPATKAAVSNRKWITSRGCLMVGPFGMRGDDIEATCYPKQRRRLGSKPRQRECDAKIVRSILRLLFERIQSVHPALSRCVLRRTAIFGRVTIEVPATRQFASPLVD